MWKWETSNVAVACDDYICHPLLCDLHILKNYFTNIFIQYIGRENNMYVDYVASEGIVCIRR